ncbi:MAG: hypothetical protein BWY99_02417 [Synergistetes bacterium ADurb.BinA166]|nr:MAG: hypothetical protein BWY99_02417 [Synergistetes bacterium ADurb.BinA166]
MAGWISNLWKRMFGTAPSRRVLPLKVRMNAMVIEDVAGRLHPGRGGDDEARNDAAFKISESTYRLIDDLSRAVESDVEKSVGSARN